MHPDYSEMRTGSVRNLRYFQACKSPLEARKESLVYLGFNYDLARGMQDELLRWAEEQRQIKRARLHQAEEKLLPRSETKVVRSIGEESLEERRAS